MIIGTTVARVAVSAFLGGPYDATTGLNDALRALPSFPLTEPYTAMGYAHVGGGGENHHPGGPGRYRGQRAGGLGGGGTSNGASPATVVATRSALVQRDGDVVATDGTNPVSFPVPAGDYVVAIRHYNHLGVMTDAPVALSSSAAIIDFRSAAQNTFGTDARKSITGAFPTLALWAGDVNGTNEIKYSGQFNDRDPVLSAIGGVVPTNTVLRLPPRGCEHGRHREVLGKWQRPRRHPAEHRWGGAHEREGKACHSTARCDASGEGMHRRIAMGGG